MTRCPVMMEREHNSKINKAKWRFFMKIVQVVLDINGLIFGGAVRDIYARDYCARQFYRKVGQNRAKELYLDTEYHEEYKDRIIIPNDLDATIHHTKLQELLVQLKQKNMCVKTLFSRDAKTYLPGINVNTDEIMHYRFEIRPNIFVKLDRPSFMSDLFEDEFEKMLAKVYKVKQDIGAVYMDLLVNQTDKDLDPPFGDLDFECNGLILSKDGIRLSRCLHYNWLSRTNPIEMDERLAEIKEDIIKKRAVPIPQDITSKMAYRTSKMIKKGFEIVLEDIQSIEPDDNSSSSTSTSDSSSNSSYKENNMSQCILCLEDLTNTKHYKLHCCEARYHDKCLIVAAYKGISAIMNTHKCIMCRQRVTRPARDDLGLLRCIFVTTTDTKDIPPDIAQLPEEEDDDLPPLIDPSNIDDTHNDQNVRRMSDVD